MALRSRSPPECSVESETAPVQRIAGIVLLRDDNSVLIQSRDDKPGLNAAGRWVSPGGHCEQGESAESAARREFLEETGYACDELRWVASISRPSDNRQVNYDLQLCAGSDDRIHPVHCYEGQKVALIAREDASRYPMPPYVPHVWDLAIVVLRSPLVHSE